MAGKLFGKSTGLVILIWLGVIVLGMYAFTMLVTAMKSAQPAPGV